MPSNELRNATSYVNGSARRYARTITQKSWTVNEKLLLIVIIFNSYVYIRALFLAVKLVISQSRLQSLPGLFGGTEIVWCYREMERIYSVGMDREHQSSDLEQIVQRAFQAFISSNSIFSN